VQGVDKIKRAIEELVAQIECTIQIEQKTTDPVKFFTL
jgi:hypothetical protein